MSSLPEFLGYIGFILALHSFSFFYFLVNNYFILFFHLLILLFGRTIIRVTSLEPSVRKIFLGIWFVMPGLAQGKMIWK
jgi:hypothetical protein